MKISSALLLLGLLGAAAPAFADEEEEVATYAVQRRQFNLGHELHASFGVLPMNAFNKGLCFGGGYTYHFSDLWAWEIGQFVYSQNIETGLKDELRQNFPEPISPTTLDFVQYFGSTNLVLKPLYGKFAWFNRAVVHAELFLVAGGGVGKYKDTGFKPAGDAGIGLRIHFGEIFSLRFDARDYVFVKSEGGLGADNELYLALSVALNFGGGER